MNLITDRTKEDVLLGTEKGRYEASDLNRVEAAVGYLSLLAKAVASAEPLITKTDWDVPGLFSSDSWPTQSQMERYLGNVKTLCQSVGISVDLPESMKKLTWDGANQIEKALEMVHNQVVTSFKGYQYSGEFFAGEENGL